MSVPLLRLSDRFDSYISGEVNIHPSAVLAPGVILQAATDSKIIIGPGVCIGMGSILQVNEGILEIEAGANLGAGFLMVGSGKIGSNACIGAATTVFNCSVAPQQLVPPGSILGDSSRQIDENQTEARTSTNTTSTNPPEPQPQEKVINSTQFSAAAFIDFKQQSTSVSPPSPTPKSQSPPVAETPLVTDSTSTETTLPGSPETNSQESETSPAKSEAPNTFGTQIYGQGNINRLLVTLFPHRQSLSDENSDNYSE
ncbi:transferase [Anabaena sphaerica FACHB-251]|uniref:Transferase n=1 Tax=Anabaena sphaerica FACHB-251 TaxID=2692883 RepID=A0A927A2R2_9NOST|nr:transferase [Anabaena sphaerica]MBD2295536.1 transferase [Anabaena sphaerica FACHB-251]